MTTYTVLVEVKHEHVEQLILSAMDGIRYWCDSYDGDTSGCVGDGFGRAFLTLSDPYKGTNVWTLTFSQLKVGIGLAASVAPKAFAALMSGGIDADHADVIMQLAVFGELVFG